MDEHTISAQLASLQDELNRIDAQLRPGSYNRISPQKIKGDLAVWGDRKSTRLPLGKNGQVLVVDPRTEAGVKWADASNLASFLLVVPFYHDAAADGTYSTMPLAESFFMNDHRHVTKIDLSDFDQARLIVNRQGVAGATDSVLKLQYHTAFSATPADYSPIGSSEVSVSCNPTTTIVASSWIDLVDAAKADVFLALIGAGGDGAVSPTFGSVTAQFRKT